MSQERRAGRMSYTPLPLPETGAGRVSSSAARVRAARREDRVRALRPGERRRRAAADREIDESSEGEAEQSRVVDALGRQRADMVEHVGEVDEDRDEQDDAAQAHNRGDQPGPEARAEERQELGAGQEPAATGAR